MNQEPSTGAPATPQFKKAGKSKTLKSPRKRRGKGIFNFLLFIGIIAAVGMFGWAEMQRRDAVSRLQETEQELEKIRESTERRGTEVAQGVLEDVRQLIDVPGDPEPTVATIVDVDALREASPFYNKAENGDHLIITETRAILYDPDRNIILDVVPVRIDREEQQQIPEGEGEEGGEEAQGDQPAEQQQEQPADQQQEEQPTE